MIYLYYTYKLKFLSGSNISILLPNEHINIYYRIHVLVLLGANFNDEILLPNLKLPVARFNWIEFISLYIRLI